MKRSHRWFLLLTAIVPSAILRVAVPEGFNETVLQHTWDVLHVRNVYDDSWGAMGEALDYVRSSDTTALYSQVFFTNRRKFQYPPSSLLPFEMVREHVDVVGVFFLIVTILAIAKLIERCAQPAESDQGRAPGSAGPPALGALVALTFYPVVKAFTLGQIQVWNTALFAMALLLWVSGKRALPGILIGLMSLIKPHYGLFLLWGLIRREYRFAVGLSATAAAGLAISIAEFGWRNHLDYLRVLSFLSRHGESFHPNQSVNGLLNRLAALQRPELFDNLRSDLFFPPYTPWVFAGTVLTSVVMIVLVLARTRWSADTGRVLDFCSVAIGSTMASPIAWEHHYGILLPVFVVLYFRLREDARLLAWLAASYVLSSQYWPVTNLLAGSPLNVLQSYLLYAALIVFTLLHVLGSQARGVGSERGAARAA